MLSRGGSGTTKREGEEENTTPDIQLPNLSFLFSSSAAKRLNIGDDVAPTHTPLTTNTRFILSQLPALRAMLTQLRPKLATLPTTADQMDWDSKREERRQYIESRTRIHLERMGELGMGDGGGIVKGRRIDGKEVHALESVVGMLSDEQR
jgi:kinetochore protein Mis12/MTW1